MNENLKGQKFIELRNKIPKVGFKETFGYVTAKRHDDIGIIVQSPYVVLDIDNFAFFEIVWRIVEDLGIKTRVQRTSRGGHFWFYSNKPLPNSNGINTALSVRTDISSYGKNSMMVVKQAGIWREWIHWDDEVDELPAWLTPIKHDYSFFGLKDGDGRNSELFNYMITLVNAGLSRTEVRETFGLINKYLFADEMSEQELSVITRDQAFEGLHDAFFEGRRFKHDVFSNYFKNDNRVFTDNGRLFMYYNGFYSDNEGSIQRRMIDYIPSLSAVQRREVIQYLHLVTEPPINKSPYHIITNNGMLDIRRPKELLPYDSGVFATNKINAYFEEDAYCEDVDRIMNNLTQHDKDLRLLLEEMIGYCLVPTARFQKAFILTGIGSNGKSTFLEMLIDLLGSENVSSLSLKELNHNFKLSEITSKLANIGDDVSAEYMEDSSIFKKLVTGEDITVDKKNEQPYKLRNTAKLVFAANEIPMTLDKSQGMARRLCIIPFDAKFSSTDEDYDPFIIDKLKTDEAHSYLLRIGMEGARRLFEQNGFTEPKAVDEAIHQYNLENNNVLGFLEENGKDLEGMTSPLLYDAYEYWCATHGISSYKTVKFNREIRNNTMYDTETRRTGETTQLVWTQR